MPAKQSIISVSHESDTKIARREGQVAKKGRDISSLSRPKPLDASQGFRVPLARLGGKRLLRKLERNLSMQ